MGAACGRMLGPHEPEALGGEGAGLERVLGFVLHHSDLSSSDAAAVGRLMCVSTALARLAVGEEAPRRAAAFASYLSSQAHRVHSLEVNYVPRRSCSTDYDGEARPLTTTRLSFGVTHRHGFQLRSLSISSLSISMPVAAQCLTACLNNTAALSRLTCVEAPYDALQDPAVQARLPAKLKQLRVLTVDCCYTQRRASPWALGHLTALTLMEEALPRLCIIGAGDTLPCSLRALIVAECTDCGTLAALSNLQQLDLGRCNMQAPQLQRLTSLAALTDVRLSHATWAHAAAAAPAWRELRLRCLAVGWQHDTGQEVAGALQHLAAATSLTRLELTFDTGSISSSAWDGLSTLLAAALTRLTLLQDLQLRGGGTQQPLRSAGAGGSPQLLQAMVQPQLRELLLIDLPLSGEEALAAVQPGAAAQLRHLTVCGSYSQEALVALVRACSPQLHELRFRNWRARWARTAVPDAVLEAAAEQLQELCCLDLVGCSDYTSAGLAALVQRVRSRWRPGFLLVHPRQRGRDGLGA